MARPCVAALHRDCTPLLHDLLAARTSMAYLPGGDPRCRALCFIALATPHRSMSPCGRSQGMRNGCTVARMQALPHTTCRRHGAANLVAISRSSPFQRMRSYRKCPLAGRLAQEAIDRCSLFAAAGDARDVRTPTDVADGFACRRSRRSSAAAHGLHVTKRHMRPARAPIPSLTLGERR